MTAVPTLLVAGFLGVGKTTLIRGWLAHRPPEERWAVLVNEFGAVGIDRALLGGGAEVFEVAGGCACCAAGVAFRATLNRLLRRGPWDRLLIETSGLGHPAQLLDQLRDSALRTMLAVLPPVAVVDARRSAIYLDDSHPAHRIATAQLEFARLLIINRAAELDPDELLRLSAALGTAPPWPRAVLDTADGRLAFEDVLRALEVATGQLAVQGNGLPSLRTAEQLPGRASNRASDRPPGQPPDRVLLPGGGVRWSRSGEGAWSCGWWWPEARLFDRRRLESVLRLMSAPESPLRARGLLRMKGVFRTERAWYGWQWDDGQQDWSETQWRTDNRLEVIAIRDFDPQIIDTALEGAGLETA